MLAPGAGMRFGHESLLCLPCAQRDHKFQRGMGGRKTRDLQVLQTGCASGVEYLDFANRLDSLRIDHPYAAIWFQLRHRFSNRSELVFVFHGQEDEVSLGFPCYDLGLSSANLPDEVIFEDSLERHLQACFDAQLIQSGRRISYLLSPF